MKKAYRSKILTSLIWIKEPRWLMSNGHIEKVTFTLYGEENIYPKEFYDKALENTYKKYPDLIDLGEAVQCVESGIRRNYERGAYKYN